MNESKASWHTSTLSQLAGLSVLAFIGAALLTAIGVIWFKLPGETAKEIIAPFSLLLSMFGASYLTARKTGEGNGVEPPKPPG